MLRERSPTPEPTVSACQLVAPAERDALELAYFASTVGSRVILSAAGRMPFSIE